MPLLMVPKFDDKVACIFFGKIRCESRMDFCDACKPESRTRSHTKLGVPKIDEQPRFA